MALMVARNSLALMWEAEGCWNHPLMLFSVTKRDLVAGWSPVLGVGVGGVGAVAEAVAELFEGVRTAPHARSDASA